MKNASFVFFASLIIVLGCASWGFYAHKKINNLAVFTLPSPLIRFYKSNINYVTNHAVDADKRRYADSLEAPRHYLDADHFGDAPFDSIPEKWNDAVTRFSEDTLRAYGIVPWQIQRSYGSLVKAFERRDSMKILRLSADLGHYIADAHVPLHTTKNHNGQLSNQVGIHGFWESRLPELFSGKYNFYVGKAKYIDDPLKEAWKILRNTYAYKDSVLIIEARLSRQYPSDRKYSFSERNGKVIKQYSEDYSAAYHKALNGLVERQMRGAVHAIGCFWYSAWVDAGQPKLSNWPPAGVVPAEIASEKKQELLFQKGKILGRDENSN